MGLKCENLKQEIYNNDYKREFAKIAKSYKKESEKENAEEREDLNK